MTTTIKATKTEIHGCGITVFFDILADDAIVGAATLVTYDDVDGPIEYSLLDYFYICEAHRGKGYGTEAIKAMRKAFGRIVAAPDSEDSRRLYERIGMGVSYLDVGFGVYEFC